MRLLKEIRNLMGSYHVKSGIYHFYRNEFKQAVDFFTKALKDEPPMGESDRRTARYFLTQTFIYSAEKLAASGDLPGAARDYVRATEVSPEFPDIRFNLGKTYEAMHRLDEAIEQYRLAIASNPSYDHARTALAFCLLRAGRDQEAVEAFGAVLAAAHATPLRALRQGRPTAPRRGEPGGRRVLPAGVPRRSQQVRGPLSGRLGAAQVRAVRQGLARAGRGDRSGRHVRRSPQLSRRRALRAGPRSTTASPRSAAPSR